MRARGCLMSLSCVTAARVMWGVDGIPALIHPLQQLWHVRDGDPQAVLLDVWKAEDEGRPDGCHATDLVLAGDHLSDRHALVVDSLEEATCSDTGGVVCHQGRGTGDQGEVREV
jgi:hypothetical protein